MDIRIKKKLLYYSLLFLMTGILVLFFPGLCDLKNGINKSFLFYIFLFFIIFFIIIVLLKIIDNFYVLHPLFIFFSIYILIFFLRPIGFLQGYQGYIHDSPYIYLNQVFKAYIYSFLGLISLYLGFIFSQKIKIINIFSVNFIFSSKDFFKLSLINVFLYIILSFYLIFKKGGIINIFENRAEIFMGCGYILNFVCFLGILSWQLFLFAFKSKYDKILSKIALFLMFLVIFIVNFILTGARGMFLFLLLIYLIFYFFILKKEIKLKNIAILAIILIIISIIFVLIRNTKILTNESFKVVDKVTFLNLFFRLFLPYDGFIEVIKKVPTVINYNYGKTYLDFFIAFIPRSLWHNKPLWGKIIFTQKFFGVENSIFSYSILGELYWNFGDIGIILGMLLWGIFLGYFYKCLIYLRIYNKSNFYFLVISSFYYFFFIYQTIRGGIFSGILHFITNYVLFMFFILCLILLKKVKIIIIKL